MPTPPTRPPRKPLKTLDEVLSVLFGKSKRNASGKAALLEGITEAKQKCLRLQKRFLTKAQSGDDRENEQLAHFCGQYAEIIEECAALVSQMLPVRDRRKAKEFENTAKELLRRMSDALQECENFDYPIKNGTLKNIADDLKSLITNITAM